MTTLKSGELIIKVEPKRTTLRTIDEMKEWRAKLAQRSKQSEQQVGAMFKLLAAMPDLAAIITARGDFNESALSGLVQQRLADGDEEHEARAHAIGVMQSKLIAIANDNPEVARTIFFPDINYASDVDSVKLAIECIRATYDPAKVTLEQIALLQESIESDFWQNVESEGVIEYANNFCKAVK